MGRSLPRNPLVLLGVSTLVVTGLTSALADVGLATLAAQMSLPVAVGLALLGYGLYVREETDDRFGRTVLVWIGYGVLSFFVIGFWFGFLSRHFDTSFFLAVVSSLAIGAAFGAIVGVYAARLRRANAELQAQHDRMEQVAGVVSHDLRNPLTVAQGRLELLRDDHESEHVESIDRSLDRMDELIEGVLGLVREGITPAEMEAVDLGTLAEQCWETVETADATLSVERTREIRADPDRLRHLLENLVRNAVEHGGEGVTVTVGDLEDGVEFYVADDGPGIPPEEREQVFESGYTTADGGTGLGLAIVREIAETHGWEVRVTESDAGGARFEFAGVS